VRGLKKSFVLGIVAFWALVTNHCGLELISGMEFLACSPELEAAPHQPGDCGDENDACAAVESGLYRAEESQVTAAKAPVIAVTCAFAVLSDLAARECSTFRVARDASLPELARSWQFSCRAALPVRAPSFAS
jgi:hypothetical protein